LFFFQAEDGIRDATVTGVQTCALPISSCGMASGLLSMGAVDAVFLGSATTGLGISPPVEPEGSVGYMLCLSSWLPADACSYFLRSEERRVGKECRSWLWRTQIGKKLCA